MTTIYVRINLYALSVSYTIYSNWYKTSMNKGNYNVLNTKEMICQQLSFYCEV